MKGPVLLLILSFVAYALAKGQHHDASCSEVYSGCTIERGNCKCGEEIGCQNPFPYKDKRQCRKDLKGDFDKCKNQPCEHGQCVQVKKNDERSWQCSCAGSGYHGKRCQHECPSRNEVSLPHDYPVDCIF